MASLQNLSIVDAKDFLQICAFTSMTVVIISTLTFVLSTMPELAEDIDVVLFDNETDASEGSVERWDQVSSNFSGQLSNRTLPACCYMINMILSLR